ncbi:F-box domain-containing protein [Mycena indigotica]|uniref:F-box domain-containing protein n=1 Tax=Mycena indigotica TaxID=2126181 RepID=A0A8H6VWR1_9AGAR|nr:F-box domain-containing protein [Mycena indigotica]KAF7296864.1 F-box domain-containing protein [Mycena indigotica]
MMPVLLDDSPFHDILTTNTPPSGAQCSEIQAFLEPHRTKLVELKGDVTRLRRLLDAAIEACDGLGSFIAAHDAVFSPIRRMPEDIMRLIFMNTLPEHRNAVIDASEGPLLLVQVCRYWRELTLATPLLWSSIHLVVAQVFHDSLRPETWTSPELPPGPEFPQYVAPDLSTWLVRGKNAPLNITVTMHSLKTGPRSRMVAEADSHMDETSATRVPPFLRSLISVSYRWRDVELVIWDVDHAQVLCKILPEDVPQLESLTLHFILDTESFPAHSQLQLLATPSLRSLCLRGPHPYPAFPASVLWQNIEALTLELDITELSDPESPLPFLHECVSLEELSLTISRSLDDSEDSEFPHLPSNIHNIILPQLETLDLGQEFGVFWNNISSIITPLHAPRLQALDLTRGRIHESNLQILAHIDHLRVLALRLDDITTSVFLSALECVPMLEGLDLEGTPAADWDPPLANTIGPVNIAPGFVSLSLLSPEGVPVVSRANHEYLAHLLPTRAPTPLVPALRRLGLSCRFPPVELLVSLIRARTVELPSADPPVARLTNLDCHFDGAGNLKVEPATVQALADCVCLSLSILAFPVVQPQPYSVFEGTERHPGMHWGGPVETVVYRCTSANCHGPEL